MSCGFGMARTIFKAVGDMCTAKNPFVADESVGSQLKEVQKQTRLLMLH